MNLHVFQHDASEGPGIIADWAGKRGHTIATSHLYRGDPLPKADDIDLLVIMGGPMNIYQDRDYPWLRPERGFIAGHVAAGRPAVGICLGSQFLADALGSRVTQNPEIEIGWFPVEFTAEMRSLFAFLPPALEVLHWHGDTFELPSGAVRLAGSAACSNQGFLYDDRILALQFHPEMTREGVSDLVVACGEELRPGVFVQAAGAILAAQDTDFAAGHSLLINILDAIFA